MNEPRISFSITLPASIHAALVREAARRTAAAGKAVGAARVAREAVTMALGLPVPEMAVGRPPLRTSTAMAMVRQRTRSTPPAAA